MSTDRDLPKDARYYAIFQAALLFVTWFGAEIALRFFGGFAAIMVSSLFTFGLFASNRFLSAETKSLFKNPTYAYRRYLFRLSALYVPVMSALQLAIAIYIGTPFIWIVSCVAIVIGGVCVLHDWQLAKDLEMNSPNQAKDPTP
jgi:hypothetical protein